MLSAVAPRANEYRNKRAALIKGRYLAFQRLVMNADVNLLNRPIMASETISR